MLPKTKKKVFHVSKINQWWWCSFSRNLGIIFTRMWKWLSLMRLALDLWWRHWTLFQLLLYFSLWTEQIYFCSVCFLYVKSFIHKCKMQLVLNCMLLHKRRFIFLFPQVYIYNLCNFSVVWYIYSIYGRCGVYCVLEETSYNSWSMILSILQVLLENFKCSLVFSRCHKLHEFSRGGHIDHCMHLLKGTYSVLWDMEYNKVSFEDWTTKKSDRNVTTGEKKIELSTLKIKQ